MKFSKKRVEAFDDYDSIRRKKLTRKEIAEQDAVADREVDILKAMQEAISKEVARFMADENIGINELTRRLQTSSRQTNRIMSGQANLTLATIAELAMLMKKVPRIVFE